MPGGVEYDEVEASYFERRRLRRHARVGSLWALGVGAAVALAIAATTFVALFVVDPVYQKVALGAAVWYAAGLLWFALVGRHRLVAAPEEAFALGIAGRGEDEEPPKRG